MSITTEQKLERKLFRQLRKTIKEFNLVEEGDRILVGLSGGKDSLCLIDFLSRQKRITFPRFEVEALHVRMENVDYHLDSSYLKAFCEERDVKFHVETKQFQSDTNSKRTPCFLCSWTRRKALFDFAMRNNFNKLALGHHNDDLLLTLLMNQTFEGSFDTMPLLLSYRKMPLILIRPLGLMLEDDLKAWAQMHHFAKQIKSCPFEHDSNRTHIKSILDVMLKLNPEARQSLLHALKKENKLVER